MVKGRESWTAVEREGRRVGAIELTVHIPATLEHLEEKNKTLLKITGENCPVMLSIHPDIKVNLNWGSWS